MGGERGRGLCSGDEAAGQLRAAELTVEDGEAHIEGHCRLCVPRGCREVGWSGTVKRFWRDAALLSPRAGRVATASDGRAAGDPSHQQ